MVEANARDLCDGHTRDGGLLSSCGDFADNAMGINGSPNWNVAIKLEGSWAGQPIPDMGFLVNCLQKDSMTEAEIPHISILIDDGKVTGALTFHDGARLDLLGKTLAGAPHTGHNLAKGKTFFRVAKSECLIWSPMGVSRHSAACCSVAVVHTQRYALLVYSLAHTFDEYHFSEHTFPVRGIAPRCSSSQPSSFSLVAKRRLLCSAKLTPCL